MFFEIMQEQVLVKVKLPDSSTENLWAIPGQNLHEILVSGGLDTGGSCGGYKRCRKCKVRVLAGGSPLEEEERRHLLPEEIKNGVRLACYCQVNEPVQVELDSVAEATKDGFGGPGKGYRYKPRAENRQVYIPGLDLQKPVAIQKRLQTVLPGYQLQLDTANLNSLAALDRAGRPAIELSALIMDGQRVTRVGRDNQPALGMVLDLGTTSLFAGLVDLETGSTLAVCSKTNMQRVYGADVLSRLTYALQEVDGLNRLRQVLINNLNTMITEMFTQAGLDPQALYHVVVAGNPVMLHFFTGVNPAGFSAAPFWGVFSGELQFTGDELGLEPGRALISVLPQIGGFVGADTVAGLLTIANRNRENFLFMDIGTNGEVVVGKKGKMWAASAAAGPAFEGGGISCGLRAGPGAIDRVWLEGESLGFHVLGNTGPRGLCGSGLIDLVASLWQAGYVDENGTFTDLAREKMTVREGPEGAEMVLAEEEQGSVLVFTQEDMRRLQLAQAAIRTASDILLEEADLPVGKLERVYLAGTFGSYLNPLSAVAIGLLPPVEGSRIRNIGNAAARGAREALLANEKRAEAVRLAEGIHYVELALHPSFNPGFIKNINLSKLPEGYS